MSISIDDLEFFPIQEIDYKHWFQSIQPNGVTPTQEQRMEMVSIIDERVGLHSVGLGMFYEGCKRAIEGESEYHKVSFIIDTVLFYVYQTTSDCMVAAKCFILADRDYDKRYTRGKLKVILNEGFKKLYGFPQTNKSETYWGRLSSIMHCFPTLDVQYCRVDDLLKRQSEQSSWWKQERDLEVHLEPIKLYESRQKELSESEVMIDTIKLLDALGIVEQFVGNLHTSLTNWLNMQYRLHPEMFKEE